MAKAPPQHRPMLNRPSIVKRKTGRPCSRAKPQRRADVGRPADPVDPPLVGGRLQRLDPFIDPGRVAIVVPTSSEPDQAEEGHKASQGEAKSHVVESLLWVPLQWVR